MEIEQKGSKKYHLRVIFVVLVSVLLLVSAIATVVLIRSGQQYRAEQATYWSEASEDITSYYEDYENEIPRLDFAVEDLEQLELKMQLIKAEQYLDQRQDIEDRIARLKQFAKLRAELDALFEEGVLKSDITSEILDSIANKLAELQDGYQRDLQPKLETARAQLAVIDDAKNSVPSFFTDETLATVREDLSREQFNAVKAKFDSLPQRDIASQYAEMFQQIDEILTERERVAEEARRKAEEERRQREAAIAAAWHVLNVPYWSQNGQGVMNGCEAAALLMGLQYKGYLKGMDLRTYSEMMPKSDDPFSGFRGKIFEKANGDSPFWIAPAPLAAFGRQTSGANVVDVTGASLDALDAEIAAGNPVIIYLTFGYVAPTEWRYGAPKNLHVMLLTGYNSLTGTQRTTDPFTINGQKTYDLSRSTVESIYNSTGKRAVVIR